MDLLYFKLFHEPDISFISASTAENKNVSKFNYFSLLSEDILLKIFSYLNADDLCRIAAVNHLCYRLSNDEILWRQKLLRDAHLWNKINSINNPMDYLSSDYLSYKSGYLNCSQHVNQDLTYSLLDLMSSFLRNYTFWNECKKICLIGPAMDVGELSILPNIMNYDETKLYSVVSLSRGDAAGFGGGFVIKTKDGLINSLIPLYTSTKNRRNHLTIDKRLTDNCIYERNKNTNRMTINNFARNFFTTVNGLIYMVEENFQQSHCKYFNEELELLSAHLHEKSKIVIIIVISSLSISSWQNSCYHFVSNVDMKNIKQSWQVIKCCINDSEKFVEVLNWLNLRDNS